MLAEGDEKHEFMNNYKIVKKYLETAKVPRPQHFLERCVNEH